MEIEKETRLKAIMDRELQKLELLISPTEQDRVDITILKEFLYGKHKITTPAKMFGENWDWNAPKVFVPEYDVSMDFKDDTDGHGNYATNWEGRNIQHISIQKFDDTTYRVKVGGVEWNIYPSSPKQFEYIKELYKTYEYTIRPKTTVK